MTLTKKILVIVSAISIGFSCLYFLLFHLILTAPIATQKNQHVQKIMAGALSVLDSETTRIHTISKDWAVWDSMYKFIKSPTGSFLKDIAPVQALRDADLSLLMVLNNRKEIMILEGYHNLKQKAVPFSLLRQKKGALWKMIEETYNREEIISGILETEYGPILAVSCPVLHSDNTGPQNGRLIMGRLINTTLAETMSEVTGEKTYFLFNHRDILENVDLPWWYTQSDSGGLLIKENGFLITIYYPVKDHYQHHAFTIRIDAQKHLFNILENATRLFFLLLILGFLLSGILFYLLVHQLVVNRVKNISARTNTIFSFDDLAQRVPVSHHDEITLLSKNINKMLERLQTESIHKDEVERMLAMNEKLIFLGRVSAGVAHEINNPLFAISNAIQLIKKQLPPDNEKSNRIMSLVEQEIKRVRNITDNMHKLSIRKIDKIVSTNLATIINAAINVVTWGDLLKHTIIDFKQENGSFPLTGNPDTLEQVFLNLIMNAIDAMSGQGQLTITITEEGDRYRTDFYDTGPGFPEDIKRNIFTPFQTTKYNKGSGMGLYISQNIIQNHGGSITLDENDTNGAHLIVMIPKGGSVNEFESDTVAG